MTIQDSTKVTGFGLTFTVDKATLQSGYRILSQMHKESAAPVACISTLMQELGITAAKATGIYAHWAGNNKPLF